MAKHRRLSIIIAENKNFERKWQKGQRLRTKTIFFPFYKPSNTNMFVSESFLECDKHMEYADKWISHGYIDQINYHFCKSFKHYFNKQINLAQEIITKLLIKKRYITKAWYNLSTSNQIIFWNILCLKLCNLLQHPVFTQFFLTLTANNLVSVGRISQNLF